MTDTADDVQAEGSSRVLTVPNALSVVRLCCLPVFLWLLFAQEERLAAAWLLLGLGATDWVDGYIARRFDQVSDLGKILDPTADRILLLGGMIAILADGSVPTWIAVAAITREALVAVTAVLLAMGGARRIDVQWVGKAGTFALMGAFPGFLAANGGSSLDDVYLVMAWAAAIPGLVLSWYAAWGYVPMAREALREGRAARSGGES